MDCEILQSIFFVGLFDKNLLKVRFLKKNACFLRKRLKNVSWNEKMVLSLCRGTNQFDIHR